MAQRDAEERGRPLRTVTRFVDERPNQEMNVIGWLIFLVLLVVILPLGIPVAILVLIWWLLKP